MQAPFIILSSFGPGRGCTPCHHPRRRTRLLSIFKLLEESHPSILSATAIASTRDRFYSTNQSTQFSPVKHAGCLLPHAHLDAGREHPLRGECGVQHVLHSRRSCRCCGSLSMVTALLCPIRSRTSMSEEVGDYCYCRYCCCCWWGSYLCGESVPDRVVS